MQWPPSEELDQPKVDHLTAHLDKNRLTLEGMFPKKMAVNAADSNIAYISNYSPRGLQINLWTEQFMINSVTQEDISSQVSSTTCSKRITAFNKSERMEVWTREYLVDRLFFEMIEIRDEGEGWDDYQYVGQKKKYYDRGADAIKMAAGRPPPIFVIIISDLTWRLKLELAGLSRDTLDYVVRRTIERICENVNSRLYHLTLKRSLGWRFEN